MISFRFHVVSITAVFLAIAIGVVVGSTYVDRAIVGNLERRIEVVRTNLDDRLNEIERLGGQLDRMNDYADSSAAFAVSGRLPDEPVLVLALRGVDDEPVRRTIELATQAGATVPGILWVEPRWALEDDGATEELGAVVDTASGQPEVVRSIVWDAVLDELDAPLLEPTGTTTSTSATTEPVPLAEMPVLDALVEGGFLSFESTTDGAELALLAEHSPALLAVTSPAAAGELQALLEPLVDASLGRGLATVVAEAFVEPDDEDADALERGETALAAVPEGTTAQLSIVDDLEQRVGHVAAVLALSDLRQSITGHYGLGDGSASIIPTWTPLPQG